MEQVANAARAPQQPATARREIGHETVSPGAVIFSRAGLCTGIRRTLPVAASSLAYGLVFGVLARGAGLSLAEVGLMSGVVCAGASQFVALGLWTTPLPVAGIILATAIVNLRHLLLGAALRPWFARLCRLLRLSAGLPGWR